MKVISAVELPTSALSIVIVLPLANAEPAFTIVIEGADEPSVTTLNFAPEPEPPVPDTLLNVPGVPPVPPAIVSICVIPLDLHNSNACLIVANGKSSEPGFASSPFGAT